MPTMSSEMGLLQGAKRNFMLGLVDDVEERSHHHHDPSSYLMRLRPTTDLSKGKNKLNAFMATANTTANLSATSMAHRDVSSIAHVDSHTTSVDHTHGHGSLRPVGRAEMVVGDDASESVKQAEMRAHVAVLRQEVYGLTQSLVDACGTEMFADLLDGSPWDATAAAGPDDDEVNPEDRQAALVANGDYLLRQYRIEMDARDAKKEAEERELRLASDLKRLSSLSTIHQGAMQRAKELQRERAAAREAGKENAIPSPSTSSAVALIGKDQSDAMRPAGLPRLKLHALEERAYQANRPTTVTTSPRKHNQPPLVPSMDGPTMVVKECVSAIDQIRAQVMLAHILQAAALHNPQGGMVDRSAGSSNRSNLTPLGESSMLGGMHTGGVRHLPTRRNDDTTNNSDFDLGTRQVTSHANTVTGRTRPDVASPREGHHHHRNSRHHAEPSPPRGRSTSPLSPMTTSILKRNSSSSLSHHHKSTTSSSTPHSSNRMANRKVVMVGDGSNHHSDSMLGNNSAIQGNSNRMQRSDMFADSSVVMLDTSVRSRNSSVAGSRGDHSVAAASTLNTEDRYKAYGGGGPVVAADDEDGDESDGSDSDLDPNVKSSSSSSRPVVRRTGGWGLADTTNAAQEPRPSESRPAASNTSAASSTVYGDEVQEMSGMSSNSSSLRPQRDRQASSRRNPQSSISQPRAPRKPWSLFGCMGGSNKKGGNNSQVAD